MGEREGLTVRTQVGRSLPGVVVSVTDGSRRREEPRRPARGVGRLTMCSGFRPVAKVFPRSFSTGHCFSTFLEWYGMYLNRPSTAHVDGGLGQTSKSAAVRKDSTVRVRVATASPPDLERTIRADLRQLVPNGPSVARSSMLESPPALKHGWSG